MERARAPVLVRVGRLRAAHAAPSVDILDGHCHLTQLAHAFLRVQLALRQIILHVLTKREWGQSVCMRGGGGPKWSCTLHVRTPAGPLRAQMAVQSGHAK
eukprot:6130353-Pleurochrysis_carterae.AAC.1